jgi:PAS domain S-box-containing protein
MNEFFDYITPFIYWLLVIIWLYIFIFYLKKIHRKDEGDKLLKLLLTILAIDAFRTLFESIFFGTRATAFSGLIPIEIYNFLVKPKIVFIPKTLNLITAALVLTMLIKRWLPSEIKQKEQIKNLVEKQVSDLSETNRQLVIAREKAREEKEQLDFVLQGSNLAYWDWNIETNKVLRNERWAEMLGYTTHEMKETVKQWIDFIHPDDCDKAWASIENHLKGNTSIHELEYRMVAKDGRVKWISDKARIVQRDKTGKPLRMAGTHLDITERKLQEKELLKAKERIAKSEEKYRLLAENSTDVVWLLDTDFNFQYSSPSTEKLFGYSLEERKTISIDKLYSKEMLERLKSVFSQKQTEYYQTGIKETITLELEGIHKDGSTLCLEVSAKFIFDNDNNIVGIQGITRNIKERKQYERQLIKAKEKAEESNRLKTEFFHNMSHEIRTPMNGILGFSAMLDEDNLSNEKRKHYISIIKSSGLQLVRIIDDIMEISKLSTKQVKVSEKEICLNDLLVRHFSLFDNKAKENKTPLYLKRGLSDKESTIITDDVKLNKLLSNLLENALKYTSQGFIEFGYTLKENSEPAELEIYVKDTGIGIKPEMHEKIFERFSQEEKEITKSVGGLGLGLSIAKENAELLGGKIRLESKKGKGATFYVTIPYKPTDKKKLGNDERIISGKSTKKLILVAEDEEVNYLYIDALLLDLIETDCTILHAKNGKDAVEICKKNPGIDFVLMDLKMPVLNGFEAARLIRELRPDLPIVALTAYTTCADKEKALAAGCDDFISKPITEEAFNETINKYLITR